MRSQTQTIDDLKKRLGDINNQLKQSILTEDAEKQIASDLVKCIKDCNNLSVNCDDATEITPIRSQQRNKEISDLILDAQQTLIDRHVLEARNCMNSKAWAAISTIAATLALLIAIYWLYSAIKDEGQMRRNDLIIAGVNGLLALLIGAGAVDAISNVRRISRERVQMAGQFFPDVEITSYFPQFQRLRSDESVNNDTTASYSPVAKT